MPLTTATTDKEKHNIFRRNWIFISGTILFVLVASFFIMASNQGDSLITINGFRSPFWDVFFKVGTQFAEPVAYGAILTAVTAFSYRRGLFAIITGITAGIFAGSLKFLFSQPRPMRWIFDNLNEVWHSLNLFEENYRNWSEISSFPSGHATSAFALYAFIALTAKRARTRVQIICLFLATMVAFSRMYLLHHFLRDITAGAALGLVLGIIIFIVNQRAYPHSSWMDRGWLDYFQKDPPVEDQHLAEE
ncbi:MAG: membrane-associated phospholipid phosphatase [Neolewinella sp.]|jgi:membrane-associated phospholipid phosphatase